MKLMFATIALRFLAVLPSLGDALVQKVAGTSLAGGPFGNWTVSTNESHIISMGRSIGGGDDDEYWTSSKPDSTDYNDETHHAYLPGSVEALLATAFILMIASAPLVLAGLAEQELVRAHLIESLALIVWLGGTLFLFTNVLKFQSAHWEGTRPLTIVEAVYLLAQILTTVGYGDITPAFPRGQVWVGLNVIVALCLYGSMISEVIGVVQDRLQRRLGHGPVDEDPQTPLKRWGQEFDDRAAGVKKSAVFFVVVATIGVLFWHFFPGENKTWLQAIYMSIITLSTVGFGVMTATTEAGKVFGAFWMMIGVAGLGALVTSFIEFMMQEKQFERHSEQHDNTHFQEALDACVKSGKMNKAMFLQYGLMITKGTTTEDFDRIHARFGKLSKTVGAGGRASEQVVLRGVVLDEEGPFGNGK